MGAVGRQDVERSVATPERAGLRDRLVALGLLRAGLRLLGLALALPIGCGDEPAVNSGGRPESTTGEQTSAPGDGASADDSASPGTMPAAGETPATAAAPSVRDEPLPPGRWRLAPEQDDGLTDEQRREMEELAAIGYADGVQAGRATVGVTIHDRARVADGVNLYVSGHAAEARLVDMDGRPLHRWALPFSRAFPDRQIDDRIANKHFWRRVALDDQGGLIAIHDGMGMVRIDKDSTRLWALPEPVHHDLEVLADGTILTLVRRPQIVPRWDAERPLLLGSVATVSADGAITDELPLLEAFEGSEFADLFRGSVATHHELADRWAQDRKGVTRPWGDIFHDNTLERLDGRHAELSPVFAEGNLLISFRNLDLLAIIDPSSRAVVWAAAGRWRQQHQPTLLDDGAMLVFSNFDGPGRSAVIEFDPLTGEELWDYAPSERGVFFSSALGTCQRLPGGNTLITESHAGRAFEVTRDGDIVWEFLSPHRAGPDGAYVANLFEVVRMPRSEVEGWLR